MKTRWKPVWEFCPSGVSLSSVYTPPWYGLYWEEARVNPQWEECPLGRRTSTAALSIKMHRMGAAFHQHRMHMKNKASQPISLACLASLQKSAFLFPKLYAYGHFYTRLRAGNTVVCCIPELNGRTLLLKRLHDLTASLGETKLEHGPKCFFPVW